MRKILFMAFALAFTLQAQAQKADIQFDKTTIDLGRFGGDDLICYYLVFNYCSVKVLLLRNWGVVFSVLTSFHFLYALYVLNFCDELVEFEPVVEHE